MNVKIQSVKFDADKKLVDFVNAKMAKLEKFAEDATSAEVIMKVDKDNDRGNKVVTIKLGVPGEELVADHRSKSFEESLDEAVEALKKQLGKYKSRFEK
jgi:putative sigma-54 modulation protein